MRPRNRGKLILSDGVATYTWDANGNLQSKTDAAGTTVYRFGAKDRLVEVSGPSVGLVQHVYDDAGDRVETRIDGVSTGYLVDANRGLSQVIEERGGSGQLVARYEHGDDGAPLARFDASTSTAAYFLHDGQGSVRQMADATASITDTVAYSAFGRTLAATGSTPSPYRYGGQWEEPRSRLYHLRARWMDPGVGRFLSTDPFEGDAARPFSLHRYLYTNQSPVSASDPSGRMTMTELSATSAIVAGLAASTIAYSVHLIMKDLVEGPSVASGERQGGLWDYFVQQTFMGIVSSRTMDAVESIPKTKTRGGRRDRQEHHTIPIYLCGSLAQTPCSVTVAEHTRLHAELAGWAIALQTAEEYADRIFLGRRRSGRVLRLADTRIGRSLIAGALRQFYSFGWVGVGIPTIGSVFPIEAEEFVNGKTSLSRNCSRTGAPPPP